MKKLILIYLLLFKCFTARSQSEQVNQKLNQFRQMNPKAFLFLHHDKGIYTNNEKIWFGAYLLNTPNPIEEHHILNVVLINEQTKEAQTAQKFSITNGLSSGFLLLPDSIPPGNYQLTAYTNVLNTSKSPVALYKSPIRVLNIKQQIFTGKLSLLDTIITKGALRAMVEIEGLDTKKKPVIVINYQVGHQPSRTAIVNGNKTIINIPESELANTRSILTVKVEVDKAVQYLSKLLPEAVTPDILVNFFPEGGRLVTGLPSRVGWEAKTNDGRPLQLKGSLMKDNEPLTEVSTNSSGMGSFMFQPEQGSSYAVRLTTGQYVSKNLTRKLPDHTSSAEVTMNLPAAIVNDSLRFTLSASKAKPILLMMHNDVGDYVLLKGQANTPATRFNLPLTSLPRGITTLTIVDESGMPLAERLFFAHYERQELRSKILMEKNVYSQGDSVRIKLKLSKPDGKPAEGIVSMSVVQNNRVRRLTPDIESYFYLNQGLQDLPVASLGKGGLTDREYLEEILLIKGWQRQSNLRVNSQKTDAVFNPGKQSVQGAVFNGKLPLTKAVNLVSLGGVKPAIVTTKPDGTFSIPNEELMVEQNKNIFFRVEGAKAQYMVKLYDDFLPVTDTLVRMTKPVVFESLNNAEENAVVKNLQNAIALSDVQITARRGSIRGTSGEKGANACGDYVDYNDEYGILNYEGTPIEQRRQPIPGRFYMKRTDLHGSYFKVDRVFYSGCLTEDEQKGTPVKGINSGKEYYMAITGLESHSTLYWQSGMVINSSGEISVAFKTGDIPDSFSVIVQGISNQGLVNTKAVFQVK